MGLEQFVTPSDDDWVEFLGILPERAAGEDRVYRLQYSIGHDESFEFTFDVFGNSVRFRWLREYEVLVDIFREGARLLAVRSGRGEAHLSIEFDTDGLCGKLDIRVLPGIKIDDNLLFA